MPRGLPDNALDASSRVATRVNKSELHVGPSRSVGIRQISMADASMCGTAHASQEVMLAGTVLHHFREATRTANVKEKMK